MEILQAGAIVFGGASGLAAATARRLAAEGAQVVIADLAADRAGELASEIGARAVQADVTDPVSVEAVVAEARSLAGGLRIAVNCAGMGDAAKLVGRDGPTPLEAFTRTINVNLLGTINVLRLCAASMVDSEPLEDVNEVSASTRLRSPPSTARSGRWRTRRRRAVWWG